MKTMPLVDSRSKKLLISPMASNIDLSSPLSVLY
jgi:hypothetical protein